MGFKKFFWPLLAFLALGLFFTGCATTDKYASIDKSLVAGDYEGAQKKQEEDATLYREGKDDVLRELDAGLLLHYSGQAQLSKKHLESADRLIRENYTKSIGEGIGTGVINDTVRTYSGEFYEDIYTNIFNSLNYIQLGNEDEAFVEVRRVRTKLEKFQRDNGIQIEKTRSEMKENASTLPDMKVNFYDSALANYLKILMYRTEDDIDNARIAFRELNAAFGRQKNVYDFPKPSGLDAELSVPARMARLNILGFTGMAPVKEEVVSRVVLPVVNTYYKLSLPNMVKRGSQVASANVKITPAAGGSPVQLKLEKLESIENVAMETYKANFGKIFARTLTRSITKAAATAASGTAGDALMNSDSSTSFGIGALLKVASLISMAATEISEQADLRTSRFFPADAYVAGVNLSPGKYNVEVSYHSASGSLIGTQKYEGVEVKRGRLNVLESVCLHKPPSAHKVQSDAAATER